MANTYQPGSKFIIGGEVVLDLTLDDVVEGRVLSGTKFHKADGTQGVGTCPYDADTSDGTAKAAEVLTGKTAYVGGEKVTGTMPNRGAVTGTIAAKDAQYTIPQGYHDGSGKVGIDSTEKAKLIAQNIRQGVTLLGIEGSMSGTEDMNAQSVSVTPTLGTQTILPDASHNCISQVNVAAIPITITENTAGGLTYTIG